MDMLSTRSSCGAVQRCGAETSSWRRRLRQLFNNYPTEQPFPSYLSL